MDRPLVEVYPVADVFASGIGRVEKLGRDLVRITMFVDAIDDLGKPIRQIVAKLIRPLSDLHGMDQIAAMAQDRMSLPAAH